MMRERCYPGYRGKNEPTQEFSGFIVFCMELLNCHLVMRKFYLFFFLLYITVPALSQQTLKEKYFKGMNELADQEKRAFLAAQSRNQMKSAASNNFDVNFYRCEWEVDPTVRYIKGKVTSYFTITAASNTISYDLHHSLTVDSIRFRNALVSFTQSNDDALHINLPSTLPTNQKDSIAI